MANRENTEPNLFNKSPFNKRVLWAGIIILLIASFITFFDYFSASNIQNFSWEKYGSSKSALVIVNDSIENMLNHQMFTTFCLKVLQGKYDLEIDTIRMFSGNNESICYFHKSFKRSFFNSIFGPKFAIYRGSLTVKYQTPPLTSTKGAFTFESEWIKYYNRNRSEEASKDQFKYLLNEYLILNDIREGSTR